MNCRRKIQLYSLNSNRITFSKDIIYKTVIILYIFSIYLFLDQRAYFGILCMLVLGYYNLTRKRKITLYTLWSFIFVTLCFLTYFWTQEPNPTQTLYNARGVLQVAIIGNLIIGFIDNKHKIEFLQKSFVIAGFMLIGKLILFFPISAWGNERLGSEELGLNSNAIGLALSISAICALNLAQKQIEKISINNIASFKKLIYFLSILLFLFIVVLTGSRKAFFLFIIGCGMLFYLNLKKNTQRMIMIPIVLLFCILGYEIIMTVPYFYNILGSRIEGLLSLFSNNQQIDDSSMVRMLLIEKGLELYEQSPYFGQGVTSFTNLSGFGFYSHNNYIELLVGVGLIGTIIYYSIYIFIIYKLSLFWYQKKHVGNIMLVIILLLAVMEYGLVSYYEELYQLLLAFSFAIINIYDKNKM